MPKEERERERERERVRDAYCGIVSLMKKKE